MELGSCAGPSSRSEEEDSANRKRHGGFQVTNRVAASYFIPWRAQPHDFGSDLLCSSDLEDCTFNGTFDLSKDLACSDSEVTFCDTGLCEVALKFKLAQKAALTELVTAEYGPASFDFGHSKSWKVRNIEIAIFSVASISIVKFSDESQPRRPEPVDPRK